MGERIFDKLGVMFDCSRNAVMKPSTVKRMIDLLKNMGYNFIMLYTEDTYEIDGQPYFGHLRGRYSKEELKDLADYAQKKDMELIPCIQTLAHTDALLKWSCYRELIDCNDIFLVGDDRVYDLIDQMFSTINECFNTKTIHIGMDEAEFLGLGKYLKINGYKSNRTEILLEHLNRISEIARKYDFNLLMWGDMFYKLAGPFKKDNDEFKVNTQIKEKIPSNVTLVYWDYYSKDSNTYDNCFRIYNQFEDNIWFAGGTWTWTGFAPHISHTERVTSAAINACKKNNVRSFITTLWGDDGGECSFFSTLTNLYWLAQIAQGNTDEESIKQGFKQLIGIDYDDYKLLELPNTPNTDNDINNPDKYMLYNDILLGKLDSTVNGTEALRYAACAEKLSKLSDNNDYGYLFNTMKCLCDVLAIKFDLGIKIRQAYKSGNKKELEKILPLLDETITRTERFFEAHEKQWLIENKPHGLDVFDIRIGGILQRIKYAKKRLQQFINSEIDSIEELDESVLDVTCSGTEKETIFRAFWHDIASPNALVSNIYFY